MSYQCRTENARVYGLDTLQEYPLPVEWFPFLLYKLAPCPRNSRVLPILALHLYNPIYCLFLRTYLALPEVLFIDQKEKKMFHDG